MKRNGQVSILTSLTISLILFGLTNMGNFVTQSSATLMITAGTDKQTYLLRQKATITGNITLGGAPATNLVVAEQVDKPWPYGHYSFRTLQVGNPTGPWIVNITSIYIQDTSSNPIDTIRAGSQMQVGMSVYNTQATAITIFATMTVYDANMAPIGTNIWAASLDPAETVESKFLVGVPKGAVSGRALIIACVYGDEIKNGGLPYCPESAFYYCISRTQSGLFGLAQAAPPPPQNTPGVYDASVRLPPDPKPGEYSVYVLGQSGPATFSSATTTFTVQTTNGIPPQASFVYWPSTPAYNETVSFDASSSTPEGYNDVITRYEWDFGDGTPHVIKTGNPPDPTATHVFAIAKQYIVTLNVTNSEGLWCTTSKPINVTLGYDPTASFTWIPRNAVINQTVTFDASGSTPGEYCTLVNYMWNFSDGTGIFNVSTSQTTHSYVQSGNYNVTLTVTDSINRTASTSDIVSIQNATVKIYDLNHDGIIDGRDIIIVARAYMTFGPDYFYPGSPASDRWNPIADVNGDNVVEGRDIVGVARVFMQDP